MPSDRNANIKYSILKHLSTEELEDLLCQDFDVFGDKEPDIDYIMAIMEVIQERETMPDEEATAIVDAAWNNFREKYQDQSTAYGTEALQESESSHLDQVSKVKRPRRKTKAFRYIVIAALVGLLMCGAASAFGFNAFQALADWTAETFGFMSVSTSDEVDRGEDPYKTLRAIVKDETEVLVIPSWIPDGAVESGEVSVVERSDGLRIASTYQVLDGEFMVRVMLYNDEVPVEYKGTYQKDDMPVNIYEVNGVAHYLMSNNETRMATWTNANVEVLIQGDLEFEDLEKMIDSIYEE